MLELWNRVQGADCNGKEIPEVAKLHDRIGEDRDATNLFPGLQDLHVTRVRNQFSDFLAKTARTFRRELFFIGCSIFIWLSRPFQV